MWIQRCKEKSVPVCRREGERQGERQKNQLEREREPFGSSFYVCVFCFVLFFSTPWACARQIGLS